MKVKSKRNYLKERGITLIALVVTIVVLLILAGVTINALFGNTGIIKRAQDAQNKMDQAAENDLKAINGFNEWMDDQVNNIINISTLLGKTVDQNTKAKDAYGNKITIPKGFKILPHGTDADSATYTYSGDNIPAVQDGIVIENETDGNQFVWVPVGTIKNKDNTTNTITLGRYEFDTNTGALKSNIPAQSAENYIAETIITVTFNDNLSYNYKELITFREGNSETGENAQNATARDLKTFIETTLANGGYYIARFEASKNTTTNKIESQYDKTVLTNITQPNAATLAREMYGEVKENNELVYASDLVNSYAWDTAIIFIQTYSTGEDASSYASQNKNTDKYCNIINMSSNILEWTTETSLAFDSGKLFPSVERGGFNNTDRGGKTVYTSCRGASLTTYTEKFRGLRSLLYVK